MIDLNDPIYTTRKLFLTKDNLLKFYTDYDYIKAYYPELEVGSTVHSPFREDKHPSFSIFYSRTNDCLLYKDFSTGEIGDFIMFIRKMTSCFSYRDAIKQIIVDFNLEKHFQWDNEEEINKTDITAKKYNIDVKDLESDEYDLKIKLKKHFEPWDIDYWRLFGIELKTLLKYHVVPIEGYFHNKEYRYTPKFSYAYIEFKDQKLTYKIYRPFENKFYKWRTNHPRGVHQGYTQLPDMGTILIITKSLKDVMSLDAVAHVRAIAIQAETVKIKDSVIDEYKRRFTKIYTLFDNDETGKKAAELYKEMYNIDTITIPNMYQVTKDFSDLVCNYGKEEAISFIQQKIYV